MKTLKSALFLTCFAFVATPLSAQNTPNPLDQFRNNQAATQQVPTRQVSPPRGQGDVLPPPTVGGFQQEGLAQAQINEALQNYNLGTASLEDQQSEVERQSRDAAFQAMLNGTLPLNPEEIEQLLERYRDVREASETRIGGAAKGDVKLQTVSLAPGVTPPVIELSPGYVTTLNILDATGQPWPIQDISWGGNFEIIQPQQGEHVVRISPMKAHEVGNLSIRLLDLNTPVIFSLRTYLDKVQYRFDAQIPELGPHSETPIIDNFEIGTTAGNVELTKILNGVPPAGTEKLTVDGVDGRTTAYDLGGQIYVRTPLTLLSPGWNSSVKSADGTTVYTIGKSPVLLLSDNGKMVRARIDYN